MRLKKNQKNEIGIALNVTQQDMSIPVGHVSGTLITKQIKVR